MTQGNSRWVESDQVDVHQDLAKLVARHRRSKSQKPFNQHTLEAFAQVQEWLGDWQGPLILDSCCGVGESTAIIATEYPLARVVGVDKSAARTNKHQHYAAPKQNYVVVRADLIDFWRLALQANWRLHKHFLLYPNPYPKSSQVHKRWHAGPSLVDIIALGGWLELRSNWQVYVQEFGEALTYSGFTCESESYQHNKAMTPFERKYWASGQNSWRLRANLNKV